MMIVLPERGSAKVGRSTPHKKEVHHEKTRRCNHRALSRRLRAYPWGLRRGLRPDRDNPWDKSRAHRKPSVRDGSVDIARRERRPKALNNARYLNAGHLKRVVHQ